MANTVVIITATGDGTFTVPAGCTSLQIECIGAGGAGAVYGGGGGSGAYVLNTMSVTPAQVINYHVGAGGSGNGEDTWFNNATHTMAKGGLVATAYPNGGAGGLASASYGTTKSSGGNGGKGAINGLNQWAGGGGGSVMSGSVYTGADGRNALSATSPGAYGLYAGVNGRGGVGKQGQGSTVNDSGVAPTAPGGGGGGGGQTVVGSAAGHNGARGQITLTYDATPPGGSPDPDNDDFFLVF